MSDPAAVAGRVREVAGEVAMLARLTRDLPRWLRTPITLDAAGARVSRGVAARDERFLRLADAAIYGYPDSPYLHLLQHAGCEAGDLRRLVQSEGLEGALKILADRGVCVSFDELKGRRETIRAASLRTSSTRR